MSETWTTGEIVAAFCLSNLPSVPAYSGPNDFDTYHTMGTLIYQLRLRRRNLATAFWIAGGGDSE